MTEIDHIGQLMEHLYDLGYEIGVSHSTVKGGYTIVIYNKNVIPNIEEKCDGLTFKDCLEEAIAFHNGLEV